MAKRLNKKLIAGLTIVGMSVTTVAGVVMVMTLPDPDPEPYVQEAEELIAAGEYEEACKRYQRASSRAREDGHHTEESIDYMIKAGDLSLQSGDARGALQAWNNVMLADRQNEEAQQRLVNFYLELARISGGASWQSLESEARKLCEINPENYIGLHALGLALINQRAIDEENAGKGQEKLEKAVEGDKTDPEFVHSLANYYFSEQRIDDAENLYNVLLKLLQEQDDPDLQCLAKAYRYRGMFYSRKARRLILAHVKQNELPPRIADQVKQIEQQARADLAKAVELVPEDVETLFAVGQYWHNRRSVDQKLEARRTENNEFQEKAKNFFKQAIGQDPARYEGYLRLAQLYLRAGELDKAHEILQKRIDLGIKRDHYLSWRHLSYMAMVRDLDFRVLLSKLSQLGQNVKNKKEYEQKQETIKQQLQDLYHRTVANMQQGESSSMALFMKGRLDMLDGNTADAIKTLEVADTKTMGTDSEIKRYLARLYLQTGQPGLAVEALQKVLQVQSEDARLWAAMAAVRNALNQPNLALQAADNALRIQPDNRQALVEKAQAYRSMGNTAAARNIRDQLANMMGGEDPVQAKLLQAVNLQLQATSGEVVDQELITQSESLLREVLKEQPLNIRALQSLAAVANNNPARIEPIKLLFDKSLKEAKQRIADESAATQPAEQSIDTLKQLVGSIEMLKVFVNKDIDEAQRLEQWEKIIRQQDDPFLVNVQLYQLCSRIPDRKEEARKYLQKAYEAQPEDETLTKRMFFTAIDSQDWSAAEKYLGKIIDLGIDPSGGHFYRGRLLLSRTDEPDNFAEATEQLKAAVEEYPSFSDGHAWLALAHVKLNNFEEARKSYQEALRLDPQNPTAVLGMTRVADITGREAELQKYLDQAAELLPNHPWVQARLQEREDQQHPEQSIARREKVRQQQPDDISNLISLAELYLRTNKPEKAGEIYEECYKLQPTNLRVVGLYARFLRQQSGDPEKAEELFRQAVDQIDDENPLTKAGAQLLLASHLNSVYESNQEQDNREQINKAFEKAAQISRNPAVLLEIGTYFLVTNQFDQAENYLKQTIAAAKNDPADREHYKNAHQRLLDLYAQTRDASRSEEILKAIDFHAQEFNENFANLARAEYLASIGRDSDALDYFTQYISQNPSDPLGYYRRGLVYYRRSQWSRAIEDLQEVKRLRPALDDYKPRIILARALQFNNQVEGAIDELQALIGENVTSFETISRLFAIYVDQKRWQSAINLIAPRRQQSDAPLWPYFLAEISRQRGETDQAIEMAVEAVQKSDYDWNMLSYLFSIYFDFERYENLVAFVQNQLPEEKKIPQVTMRLANAHRALGQIDQAVQAYQEAYSAEDASPGELVAAFKEYASSRSSWLEPMKEAVKKRMQTQPDDRGLKIVLAYLHQLSGEDQAFIDLMKELHAATVDGQGKTALEQVYFNRALASAHYKLGNYKQSRKFYRKVLELQPKDPPALNNLAYLLMDKLGDPKSAMVYAQRAAEMLPENSSVLDTLGWNNVLLEKYDEGIGWLYRAIELSPRSPSMHYHVAAALYKRSQKAGTQNPEKDLEEAKKECTRAHELIMETGIDPNNDLEKIVNLGQKLGLDLKPSPATG